MQVSFERVVLFKPFVGMLKEVKKSAPYEDQKLAIRILEAMAEKEKNLVHPLHLHTSNL